MRRWRNLLPAMRRVPSVSLPGGEVRLRESECFLHGNAFFFANAASISSAKSQRGGGHTSTTSGRPRTVCNLPNSEHSSASGSSAHRHIAWAASTLLATAAAGAAGAALADVTMSKAKAVDQPSPAVKPSFPPVWFGFESGFGEQYTLGKVLGQGSYGQVFSCVCIKDRQTYAVKVMDKMQIRNAESIEDIDREVEILTLVRGHENVIDLKGAYEDAGAVYLVMDACEGGDLYRRAEEHRRLRRLTESHVAQLVTQILRGVAHCHLKGVVLCDVKPDNFLFDKPGEQGTLKAIDFGLSRKFTPGRALRRAAGTAYFVAPEVLRFEYGPESDMWSVGVIAYWLLSGRMPFDGETEKEILIKVVRGEGPDFDSPEWRRVSPEAKSLVRALLNRDAALRPSASSALSHAWFKKTMADRHQGRREVPLDAAVLSAMNSYASSGKMRKMAIRAMARDCASANLEAVLQLEEQFKAIDKDGSGMISLEELSMVLQQSSLKHTDAEMQKLLQDLDMAGEGEINYLEFVAAAINLHQLHSENEDEFRRLARAAFEKFDVDKSGFFTATELKEVLKTTRKCYSQGLEVTDLMVAELISQVDTDGDGKVSFDEFLALLHTNRPSNRSRYGWIKTPSPH